MQRASELTDRRRQVHDKHIKKGTAGPRRAIAPQELGAMGDLVTEMSLDMRERAIVTMTNEITVLRRDFLGNQNEVIDQTMRTLELEEAPGDVAEERTVALRQTAELAQRGGTMSCKLMEKAHKLQLLQAQQLASAIKIMSTNSKDVTADYHRSVLREEEDATYRPQYAELDLEAFDAINADVSAGNRAGFKLKMGRR